MTNDELHELAPLFALDALDGDELAAFEAHLDECAQCRTEVDELQSALSELPAAEVAPPAALRASVLAEIDSVDQEDASPGRAPLRSIPRSAAAGSGPIGSGSSDTTGAAAERAAAGRGGRAWWIGAAAAAVVAIVVGVGVVSFGSSDSVNDEVAAVLELPDATTVSLVGDSGAMTVTYSPSTGRAALTGDGLGQVPAGSTYQLWAISGETPRDAGVFAPDDDGAVEVPVDITDIDADAWAVTVEPAGGSSAPTGDIVMVGETA